MKTIAENLTEARKNLEAAREVLASLKAWNTKKRDATEAVEFWGNKVAMLGAMAKSPQFAA